MTDFMYLNLKRTLKILCALSITGGAGILVSCKEGKEEQSSECELTEKLFVLAATGPGNTNNVVYRTVDGATWDEPGQIPVNEQHYPSVVFANRIVILSGPSVPIWSSADGVSWVADGSISQDSRYSQASVFKNKIWLTGGLSAPAREQIYYLENGQNWVSANGPNGLWDGHSMITFDEKLWIIGGRKFNPNAHATDRVLTSADGINWATPGMLPLPRSFGSAAVFKGKIWYAGGEDAIGNVEDEVWNSSDGNTWSAASPLPEARNFGALIAFREKLWFVGGGGTNHDNVWSTEDGTVWTVEANLPSPSQGHSPVVFATCR